ADSDPRRAIATIRGDWRKLAGGHNDRERATLVALSGGADSSALLIALAGVRPARIIAAHIRHPLRPAPQADADRAAAHELCSRLGVHCLDAQTGELRGNAEAAARSARYAALESLAGDANVGLIATGHHGDDQAETVLMRLIRGAGPQGLVGIRASRRQGACRVIRPMLRVTRRASEAICSSVGWQWAEDQTNRDVTRLRARLRSEVMPALRELSPGLGPRLSERAWVHAGAARVLRQRAAAIARDATIDAQHATLARSALSNEPRVVRSEVIRQIAGSLVGQDGTDARTARTLERLARAIGDTNGSARTFELRGLSVRVDRDIINIVSISRPPGEGRR
ncbi:MAG: tRNA lysidine(34) synthetase TilS, partial [Planctomycetota bacterium]